MLVPIVASLIASTVSQTPGCGSNAPYPSGRSTTIRTDYGGVSRSYILRIPPGYNRNEPAPVVWSFHGWGNSASSNEGYLGLNEPADAYGHILIIPEGRSDYNRETNSGWQSFNAVGSTDTLPSAPECTRNTNGYCYQSCNARPQGCGKCDWTTCADDGGYVNMVLDDLEKELCLDKSRYYATGYSNGGMMAYEIGMSVLERFAAIVPGGGQPFVGHNNPPPTGKGGLISVLDLHGTRDRVCPGNDTTSSDGWNYEPVDNVLRVWAEANGCSNPGNIQKFNTNEDGEMGLWCVSFGNCPSGVDIVRCSYNGGHDWPGGYFNGNVGARLAFDFFRHYTKISANDAIKRGVFNQTKFTLNSTI